MDNIISDKYIRIMSPSDYYKDFVAYPNPEREHFDQAIDWSQLREFSNRIPQIFVDTLAGITDKENWEEKLRSFLYELRDVAAESMGIDPDTVELKFDLKIDFEGGSVAGKLEQFENGKNAIHALELKMADVASLDDPISKAYLSENPNSLSKQQSEWFSCVLAEWILVIIHEMYHARQAQQTPKYFENTLHAAYQLSDTGNEQPPERDLGEHSAAAVSLRGLKEIYNQLLSKEVEIPLDLDFAIRDLLISEKEVLKVASLPLENKEASWDSFLFRPKWRKKTERERR
jgi:hypothetical protein